MVIAPSASTRSFSSSSSKIQTRGSSTIAGAWGAPAPTSTTPIESSTTTNSIRSTKPVRPLLSLGLSSNEGIGSNATTKRSPSQGHPLKCDWDVYFSHRSANTNKNKKDDTVKVGLSAAEKEQEARDEWSTNVVKLGGFSSIESLHPFLAHLTPPSALPASLSPPTNVISDINLFRSGIQPVWEDRANVGGGRFVLRLRKGVADRVWEEIVYSLVGERIGGNEAESGGVNGVVLSVRKEEDILSVWCKPCSRSERDIIRDSIRVALEPLLSPSASAALVLDFKPHPASNNSNANSSSATPLNAASHNHTNGTAQHRDPSVPRERPSRTGFGAYSRGIEENGSRRDNTDRHATPAKERSSSTGWGPSK